jgi:hypothetical protein
MTTTSRPPWVDAANEGRGGPVYDAARAPFSVGDLVAQARLETGCDDLGPDDWFEPLTALVDSANRDGRLHTVGRWRLRDTVLRLLRGRLLMVAGMTADPSIERGPVTAPIIVTGSPRSGTTILHQLLALEPSLRAPLSWEFWMPWPSPGPGRLDEARIALADRELRLNAQLASEFDTIHEMTSTNTRECGAAMSFSFRSEDIDGTYPLPSYTSWLRGADWQPALAWHRRVLQVLAHGSAPRTWVLKNPAYLGCLDALAETYPDAQLVVTHRDPVGMISSLVSLYATLHGAHGDDVEVPALAANLLDRHAGLLNGLVDWVRAHPETQIHHVKYDEFLAAPVEVIGQIHRAAGREMSAATAAAVSAYLRTHPQHRHGSHEHSLAAIGLDESAVRERFTRYTEFFDIGTE